MISSQSVSYDRSLQDWVDLIGFQENILVPAIKRAKQLIKTEQLLLLMNTLCALN